MSVGLMPVPGYELAVDADVELSVVARQQLERLYAVSRAVQGLTRHPGGSRGVPSILTVLDLYVQLFAGHFYTPLYVVASMI